METVEVAGVLALAFATLGLTLVVYREHRRALDPPPRDRAVFYWVIAITFLFFVYAMWQLFDAPLVLVPEFEA